MMPIRGNNLRKNLIYTTLTLNSTTLYTYENFQLQHLLPGLNCSEIISQELGLINSSKTLIGSMPVTSHISVTNTSLILYFMKKVTNNLDGSNDLITVLVICHSSVNKMMVLSVMKKIVDQYIQFKSEMEVGEERSTNKIKSSEFKVSMNEIIRLEETNYDTNSKFYGYGSTNVNYNEDSGDMMMPDELILATEDIKEVRNLMYDNISKILNRGDKISSLVDQTEMVSNSSLLFQRRAQSLRHKFTLTRKSIIIAGFTITLVIYFLIGAYCGYPFYNSCLHHKKTS